MRFKWVVPCAFALCLRDEPTRDVSWSSLAGEETARAYLRKAPGLLIERGEFLQTSMASIVALLGGDVLAAKKVRNSHPASVPFPGCLSDAYPSVCTYYPNRIQANGNGRDTQWWCIRDVKESTNARTPFGL